MINREVKSLRILLGFPTGSGPANSPECWDPSSHLYARGALHHCLLYGSVQCHMACFVCVMRSSRPLYVFFHGQTRMTHVNQPPFSRTSVVCGLRMAQM